jgi:hypothetical protein
MVLLQFFGRVAEDKALLERLSENSHPIYPPIKNTLMNNSNQFPPGLWLSANFITSKFPTCPPKNPALYQQKLTFKLMMLFKESRLFLTRFTWQHKMNRHVIFTEFNVKVDIKKCNLWGSKKFQIQIPSFNQPRF